MNKNHDEILVCPKIPDWMAVSISVTKESCVHKSCPDCKGSGTKSDGNMCVHYISCSCSKCNPVEYRIVEWK